MYDTQEGVLEAKGRHDPCVVPRAVPIVEAMAALVIIDALLSQEARQAARSKLPRVSKRVLPPELTEVEDARAKERKFDQVQAAQT